MKVALLPNLTRERAPEVTADICSWLDKYGAEFATLENDILTNVPNLKIMKEQDLVHWCDVVITVGGDGSMLLAAKKTVEEQKPVLCINAGRLAFMAGLESNELELLKDLINGNYRWDKRMLLDVTLERDECVLYKDRAINDVVVARGNQMKMTDLVVNCNDRKIIKYHADGIIVATPTGSSGYSLSAGGPVINPVIEAIVVTPICAHSLFNRSIVFDSSDKITLFCDENTSYYDLYLSVDGESTIHVTKGDIITIRKSDLYANFIRIKNDSFFEILNHKLAGMEGSAR